MSPQQVPVTSPQDPVRPLVQGNALNNSRRDPSLRSSGAAGGSCDRKELARHREAAQQRSTALRNRGSSGESLVLAVPYLSSGFMRRARRWAWVVQRPDDLPPRGGILMGLQSGLPAKWLCVPRRSVRVRAAEQRPAGVGGGSPGNSPPAGVTRETPSASDSSVGGPVLSSAHGSLPVITLADGGPRPLTRADLLYVRSEPVPLFVHFLQAFFSFLPWLHRALSCGVLLLMRRLHLFVLRLFLTCEDFRLRSAPDIPFSTLSEFTADPSRLFGTFLRPWCHRWEKLTHNWWRGVWGQWVATQFPTICGVSWRPLISKHRCRIFIWREKVAHLLGRLWCCPWLSGCCVRELFPSWMKAAPWGRLAGRL